MPRRSPQSPPPPMRVIVVTSRKGGGGKTTLAVHLAVEAERAGVGLVGIIDVDTMCGSAGWWDKRKAVSPCYAHPNDPDLATGLDKLRARGCALAIIDTPPQMLPDVALSIILRADLVLVPVQPSPDDLDAIGFTITLIERARRPAVFVLNRVKPRVRLTGEAAINLSQYGTVAPVTMGDRYLYAGAKADGRTAPELEPAGPAAAEMQALWSYVSGRLALALAPVAA